MGEVEPKVYGGGGGRSWTNRTRIRKVLLVLPRLLSFFPCFSRFSRVEIKGERKEKRERERKASFGKTLNLISSNLSYLWERIVDRSIDLFLLF